MIDAIEGTARGWQFSAKSVCELRAKPKKLSCAINCCSCRFVSFCLWCKLTCPSAKRDSAVLL